MSYAPLPLGALGPGAIVRRRAQQAVPQFDLSASRAPLQDYSLKRIGAGARKWKGAAGPTTPPSGLADPEHDADAGIARPLSASSRLGIVGVLDDVRPVSRDRRPECPLSSRVGR